MRITLAVATLPLILMSMATADATSPTVGVPETPQRKLETVNVLPLALDDRYQFRKVEEFLYDPRYNKPTTDEMVAFERQRVVYGAVTASILRPGPGGGLQPAQGDDGNQFSSHR